MDHTLYMQRCFELALNAFGHAAPNPMVGSVFVYDDRIIAEGFHTQFGKAHAEVEVLQQLDDAEILGKGTLYVNLEPCSHFGKTPPCTDLIIKKGIKKVVVANVDPFEVVNGSGISKLKNAGIELISGILEKEGAYLNRRFFTFHQKQRPFIILKWAQSRDGFIGSLSPGRTQISNESSNVLVHQWRSQEQAILIGKNTALSDNPRLTARKFPGKNPVRIVLDSNLSLPTNLQLFDQSEKTIVINNLKEEKIDNIEYLKIERDDNFINNLLKKLVLKNIQSVLVEGGTKTINMFLKASLWDECRIITSSNDLNSGIAAPVLNAPLQTQTRISNDMISYYRNNFSI